MQSFFIVGGAGFIGSHFVEQLLKDEDVGRVTIYDNMSSGREWHFASHQAEERCLPYSSTAALLRADLLCALRANRTSLSKLCAMTDKSEKSAKVAMLCDYLTADE